MKLSLVLLLVLLSGYAKAQLGQTETPEPTETTELSSTMLSTTTHLVTTTVNHTTEPSKHTTEPSKPTATSIHSTQELKSTTPNDTPTTPTDAPTTTPTPTVPSTPKTAKWFVNESDIVCILFEAGIRLTFNYTVNDTTKNITVVKEEYQLDVPVNGTTANGTCGTTSNENDKRQNIWLTFFGKESVMDAWNLNLTFYLNATTKSYDLETVSLIYQITPEHFPGAELRKKEQNMSNVERFGTDNDKAYMCKDVQEIYPNNTYKPVGVTNGLIKIETYDLSFEAFRNLSSTDFSSKVNHCSQDTVSQLVPIIVGAALGGLILVVLIAYLIGRKRSRRGYESV